MVEWLKKYSAALIELGFVLAILAWSFLLASNPAHAAVSASCSPIFGSSVQNISCTITGTGSDANAAMRLCLDGVCTYPDSQHQTPICTTSSGSCTGTVEANLFYPDETEYGIRSAATGNYSTEEYTTYSFDSPDLWNDRTEAIGFGNNASGKTRRVCQTFVASAADLESIGYWFWPTANDTDLNNWGGDYKVKLYSGAGCDSVGGTTLLETVTQSYTKLKDICEPSTKCWYSYPFTSTLTPAAQYSVAFELTPYTGTFDGFFNAELDGNNDYTCAGGYSCAAFKDVNGTWSEITGKDLAFSVRYYEEPPDYCSIDSAVAAALISGQQTISASGTCAGFFPSSAWIGAVRISPIGAHYSWSEGYGPFPDPYSFSTTEVPGQPMENGTYRVRMYARNGTTLVASDNYIDVVLNGNAYNFLTDTGNPSDHTFSATDPIIGYDGDTGYTFSASTAEALAAGGLRIDADGCAHTLDESATSTLCGSAEGWEKLVASFPLLSWPLGIFTAMVNAQENTENAATSYVVGLPAFGEWAPAVTLVDSASAGKGIGQYISPERQQFYRSILTFGVWVLFVLALKRKADHLINI